MMSGPVCCVGGVFFIVLFQSIPGLYVHTFARRLFAQLPPLLWGNDGMEQQYLSGSGEASSPAARTLRSSISTGRLQLHSGSPSHASMSPIKRPATGKPKQPGVELVDQESKPVTPPRLFDYAMGLGTAAAAAVPVLSLPQYERKYGSLLDYGDPAAPLRDVVRTTLFSPEPFWDHLSAKYKENYSYLTGIERTFRWAAGVA